MLSFPAKGSARVLKTRAEKGSSSAAFLFMTSSDLGFLPSMGSLSEGFGNPCTITSISWVTPILSVADPHTTGIIAPDFIPSYRVFSISLGSSVSPSRYFSMSSSLASTIFSIIDSRCSSIVSAISEGMSAASDLPEPSLLMV